MAVSLAGLRRRANKLTFAPRRLSALRYRNTALRVVRHARHVVQREPVRISVLVDGLFDDMDSLCSAKCPLVHKLLPLLGQRLSPLSDIHVLNKGEMISL
jgi:hypothetical protein